MLPRPTSHHTTSQRRQNSGKSPPSPLLVHGFQRLRLGHVRITQRLAIGLDVQFDGRGIGELLLFRIHSTLWAAGGEFAGDGISAFEGGVGNNSV